SDRSKASVARSGACSSSLLSPWRAAEPSSMPLRSEAMSRCASSRSAASGCRIRSSSTMSALLRFGALEPAPLASVELVLESVPCAREFGQALEVRLVVGGHLLVLVGDLRIQLVHSPFDRGQFLLRRSCLSTGELRPRCPIRRGGSTVVGTIRGGAGRGGPARACPTRGGATGTVRGPALLFGP